MVKLTNLKTLDLYKCCNLNSLPACLNLVNLKLIDCTIKSLPTSLRHLEILHFQEFDGEYCNSLEECLNQLVNLETLSITCYKIKLFPSMAGIHNLRKLQLKDCFSLEKLPPYLDGLAKLCTLDISGTRIKLLPDSIMRLPKLEQLILPNCFRRESLLGDLKKVSIIDNTDETYYKHAGYYNSCYKNSTETCDGSNDIVPRSIAGVNESVLEDSGQGKQTSEPEGCQFNGSNNLNDENSQYAVCSSQNQEMEFLPSGNEDCVATFFDDFTAESVSNLQETYHFSENSHHTLQYGRVGTMTLETEQGIAPFDTRNFAHWHLHSLSDNMKGKTQNIEITPEKIHPLLSKNMRLIDAAKQLGVSRSTMKRKLKIFSIKWPSSRKRKHLDAKKRKNNTESPFGSNFFPQNLVNPTNPAVHTDNVNNSATNTTMATANETQMPTQYDMDGQQHVQKHLDGANECALPNSLRRNESSSTFIVKATYKEDTVRFEFSMTCNIELLKEEVGKRLELEISAFKMKYQDEDKEWILMTCISDLEHALGLSRSSESNVVRLSIVLKT